MPISNFNRKPRAYSFTRRSLVPQQRHLSFVTVHVSKQIIIRNKVWPRYVYVEQEWCLLHSDYTLNMGPYIMYAYFSVFVYLQ